MSQKINQSANLNPFERVDKWEFFYMLNTLL